MGQSSHAACGVAPPKPKDIETRLFIDGEFVEATSTEWFQDFDPATEEVICRIREASTDDVDRAVEAAARAFPEWSLSTSAARRAELLQKLADLVVEHEEELAALESLDAGKPYKKIIDGDLKSVVRALRYYAGWADKITGKTVPVSCPDDYFCYTRKEPVGVVAGILPWNYPLYLLAIKLAPALTCGCTIVIKTSEKTPLSALLFAKLIQKAGFPKGVVNILTGRGPTVGRALTLHPRVNKISFTGGTSTGREIAKNASGDLKRVTLELGGKSALIVLQDADLRMAATAAFHGLFSNSGAPRAVEERRELLFREMGEGPVYVCHGDDEARRRHRRVLVHASVHDAFLHELQQHVQQDLHLLSPFDERCTQGPLVDKIQYEKVLKYINEGVSGGAKLVCGGKPKDGRGYWVQPTIFTDVTDDMVIAREEIFGPVICVLKFTSLDEAVKRANELDYGLGAAICTKNFGVAYHCANRLKAGNVFINCYNYTDVAAPFGGVKHSGYGREGGEEGLLPYLEVKTVYTKVEDLRALKLSH